MSNSTSIYLLSASYIDNTRGNFFTSTLIVSLDYEVCLNRMNEEINNRDTQLKYFFPVVGFDIATWVNNEEINTQSYDEKGKLK